MPIFLPMIAFVIAANPPLVIGRDNSRHDHAPEWCVVSG